MPKIEFSRDFHEVTHFDMLRAWRNDQRREVIENLAKRHPAIAVTFVVQALADGEFNQEDANVVANMLNDHFMALRDRLGVTATERRMTSAKVTW